MTAAIVIPVYKADLSETEKYSFYQCLRILHKHDIILVVPKGLKPDYLESNIKVKVVEFDPGYFDGIAGYNRLLLSDLFYQRFLNYDYMLIHQLDAFVFKDELHYWCEKDYDYIGAPWLNTENPVGKFLQSFNSNLKRRSPTFYNVGNGGFSLRKTKTFFEVAQELKETIEVQLSKKQGEIYMNEDVFWSLRVPEFIPHFTIPHYKEAAKFALDRKPKIGMKLNNFELPFGCHGFNKPKVVKFWEPIIRREFRERS